MYKITNISGSKVKGYKSEMIKVTLRLNENFTFGAEGHHSSLWLDAPIFKKF